MSKSYSKLVIERFVIDFEQMTIADKCGSWPLRESVRGIEFHEGKTWWPLFRGNEKDLLDRAWLNYNAEKYLLGDG